MRVAYGHCPVLMVNAHVGDVVLIAVRLKHGLRHGSLQNLHSGTAL